MSAGRRRGPGRHPTKPPPTLTFPRNPLSEPLAASAAVIVFGAAIGFSLVLVAIEAVASRWDAGPSIGRLLEVLTAERYSLLQLRLALIRRLDRDFDHNEQTLTRIRWLLALQALIVLAEAVILLLGFYELT